jgi:hypothetical protein
VRYGLDDIRPIKMISAIYGVTPEIASFEMD